jgi:hypothetical protein
VQPEGPKSLASVVLEEQPAIRSALSESDLFNTLKDRLKKTPKIDGQEYYVAEGDTLLDEDQLLIYAQQRQAREIERRAAEAASGAGLGVARLVGVTLEDRSRGLLGMVQGGRLVRWQPGLALSYAVLRDTFPSEDEYRLVCENMRQATKAWEDTCGVSFQHREDLDSSRDLWPAGAIFTVRYIDTGGTFIAAAFFPNDPVRRRRVLIDPSYFRTTFDKVGVLRHELGHVLGFRHEHIRSGAPPICPDEDPTGTIDLTQYDPQSVMHYFCGNLGSRDLAITELDRTGAQKVYGPPLSAFELIGA